MQPSWSPDEIMSLTIIHSQKSHRPVARCWFYRLAVSCQQVATGLLVSSGGNRLAGTGLSQAVDNRAVSDLLKQPATNLLLTRDNRSDRTTCSKSVEINRFVPAIFKTRNGESGNRRIRESRTDKTGILVCLLENAFATLFGIIQTMNIQYTLRVSCLTI